MKQEPNLNQTFPFLQRRSHVRPEYNQTVTAGDRISLSIEASVTSSAQLDAVGFVEIGGSWIYLGRQPFTGTFVTTTPITFAEPGTYVLKIVLIGHGDT